MTGQRGARLAVAFLALTAAAAVLAVTVAGLVGLAVALFATEPWSQGRVIAAGFLTAGLVLLLLAHALDPQAMPNAAQRARATAAGLLHTVASGGR